MTSASNTIQLTLSERKAEYLKDILDFWMDDVDLTHREIHKDTGMESAEMLTICAVGIEVQFKEIKELRQDLWEAMRNVSNNNRSSSSDTGAV